MGHLSARPSDMLSRNGRCFTAGAPFALLCGGTMTRPLRPGFFARPTPCRVFAKATRGQPLPQAGHAISEPGPGQHLRLSGVRPEGNGRSSLWPSLGISLLPVAMSMITARSISGFMTFMRPCSSYVGLRKPVLEQLVALCPASTTSTYDPWPCRMQYSLTAHVYTSYS